MNTMDATFFQKVFGILETARKNVKTAVNLSMVYSYYEVGRMIVEEEQNGKEKADYGKYIIKELSQYLTEKFGKGFSVTNLKQMRQFYITYSQNQIGQTLSDQFPEDTQNSKGRKFYLSWSHYLQLMRIESIEERNFYEIEAIQNDWSLSELKRQYNSALFERLSVSKDRDKVREMAQKGQIVDKPVDIVKDPYILEFLGLDHIADYSETELETKIIDELQKFLLELGKGFAFVGRQVRFTFEEEHYRVDLVFYNRLLRCFVLFDLKIGELKHQDIGQMQMYVNYYDRKMKLKEENKTIRIILCNPASAVLFCNPIDSQLVIIPKIEPILERKAYSVPTVIPRHIQEIAPTK